MTKFDFVVCTLTIIGILVAAIKLFSDRFSERSEGSIYLVLASVMTLLATLSIATYVEFIYYSEFILWRFVLTMFTIFTITYGVSSIIAVVKVSRDDKRRWREFKRAKRATDKSLESFTSGCGNNDRKNYPFERNLTIDEKSVKSDDAECDYGKIIYLEEVLRNRKK